MEGTIAILIPILVPLGAFAMIYYINREENQTKRAMIEHGMTPNEKKDSTPTPGAIKFGGLLIGGGLGLFLASVLNNTFHFQDSEAIYFGLIALLGGIGLVLAHNYARKQYFEDQERLNK